MRINDVIGQLTSAFNDWDHLLANPRYVRRNRIITWQNYYPGFVRLPVTNADLVRLSDEGQYTFQFLDGSMLQLFYAYGNADDDLIAARLAYYMAENLGVASEEEFGADEALAEASPVNWFRLDYTQRDSGVLHSSAHLHLAGFPDGRLMVAGVPTPRQFVELVVSFAYPDAYRRHRLDENGGFREPGRINQLNSVCVQLPERATYTMVPHFRIPAYPVLHGR